MITNSWVELAYLSIVILGGFGLACLCGYLVDKIMNPKKHCS